VNRRTTNHCGLRIILPLLAILSITGCNWLVPFTFLGEHKRTMPAEFSKLAGQRALVLVWADPATLFDYPHVRLEMASYISDKIRAHLEDTELVDPAGVEDFLNRELTAAVDPITTGEKFDADYVIHVELLHFQMRDPSTPDLIQGDVRASVAVFDLNAEPDRAGKFSLSPVAVKVPENSPMLMSSRNLLLIRQQTYDTLSEFIARKFYEYQIDL
jgi:hypothetical protein